MSATRFAGSQPLKIAGKPVRCRHQKGPPRALRAVAVVAMQLAAVQPLLTWPHLAMAQDCQTPNATPTVTPQDAQEGTSSEAPPASYTTTDPDFTSSSVSTSYVSQSSVGDYGDGGGSFSTTSGTDYNGTDSGGTTTVWTGGNIGGSNIDTGSLDSVFNPIDVRLADKTHVQVDYVSMGAAPVRLARAYHSSAAVNSARVTVPMGTGWHMFYDRSLQVISGSQVRLHRANGRTLDFKLNGSVWVSTLPAGVLTPIAGGWSYVNQRDGSETYDANGRLLGMADGGLVIAMTYDGSGHLIRAANPFGRGLSLAYDAAGRVATVTLPDGNTLGYAYDARNNLTSVRFADGAMRRYAYENASFPNALTGVIDESGRRRLTWGYDAAGRPNRGYYGSGTGGVSVVYNGSQVTTTDALGTQRVRNYGAVAGRQVLTSLQTAATPNSAATAWSFGYDANGNPLTINTRSGEVQQLATDGRGRLTALTRAAGTSQALTVNTTWHPTFHKPTQVVSAGVTSNYTIDTSGRVTRVSSSAGSTNAVTYAAVYNAQNLVQSTADTRGVTTSYSYDASGNVASVINNALGQTTYFQNYDAHGQPTRIQRPDGTIVTRSFDTRGRLITRTDPNGTTQFAYDGAGRVTSVTAPDASWKSYAYDAAGLLSSIANNRGETSSIARDVTGAVTKSSTFSATGALTAVAQRQLDAVGRIAAVLDSHGNRTQLLYGSDGRPSGLTNALNLTTNLQLDTLNRLTTVIQPNTTAMRLAGGPITTQSTFAFDSLNNLLSAVDTNAVASSYTYDALNRRIGEAGADPGSVSMVRNIAGDVTSITDALDTTYTGVYDPVGRIRSVSYAGASSPITAYNYVAGRSDALLASMVDASGSTAWTYDSAGRTLSKQQITNGASLTATIVRDTLGRPGTVVYPSGMRLGITYSGDTVAALTINGTPLLSNISYLPFSQVATGWRWGNGSSYGRAIDADGHVTAVTLGSVQRSYGYDAAGRITRQIDVSSLGTKTGALAYDEAGHLISYTGLAGPNSSGSFSYDTNGNRRSSLLNGIAASYVYAPSSNRNTGDLTNLFNKYNADGSASLYNWMNLTYGDFGRLTSAVSSLNPTLPQLASAYNGLGQRVLKTVRTINFLTGWTINKTDRFFYDDAGHPLGEYDSTSGYQQETVWFNGQPVATVMGGNTYYVFADNLGSPRSIVQASNNAEVWRWDSDPFGTAAPSGQVTYNMRFPGQVADIETGLFQNGFRDYDPLAGRYIQSDPIGLKGGLSRYAYVGGNPISRVDPTGLLNLVVGGGGAVVGIAAGADYNASAGYNFESGSFTGYTTTGVGAGLDGGQYGLYAGAGGTISLIRGDASNVGGAFINYIFAIPGTNISFTGYTSPDGSFQGVGIGYGPGIGFTRTTTNTEIYPMQCNRP